MFNEPMNCAPATGIPAPESKQSMKDKLADINTTLCDIESTSMRIAEVLYGGSKCCNTDASIKESVLTVDDALIDISRRLVDVARLLSDITYRING